MGCTILDYEVYSYEEVSSTNEVAKEIARRSEAPRIVVLAETQTSGKGRFGRNWISPKGGIWLSILLRQQTSPTEALKSTFLASSAAAEAIERGFALQAELKWPNDVLVNGKKICGVLAETTTREGSFKFLVVGVGINANVHMKSFPKHLRDRVTSLKHELDCGVELKSLTLDFLEGFDRRFKRMKQGYWSNLLQEWKGRASFLGKRVEVRSFEETLVGQALDIDEDCALIIRLESGITKKARAGDLQVRS